MRKLLLISGLTFFAFLISGCSGKLIDSKQLMNADKIIYRFKDSSVPPQYHRSYEIAVTKNEARIVVDSYGDILSKDVVKLKDEQFAEVLETIKQAKIAHISDTSDDGSCSGGTSEYIDISDGKKKIIDGNVYHCGKQDFGNMIGDFDVLSDKLKSLFPNFQTLLKK